MSRDDAEHQHARRAIARRAEGACEPEDYSMPRVTGDYLLRVEEAAVLAVDGQTVYRYVRDGGFTG